MAYTKFESDWQSGQAGGTPITEAALDHIEQGVYDAHGPAWVFTAFTPTWTSSGTAPAIGNGTLTGRYVQIGDLVIAYIEFVAGSSSTFGTGTYSWALPVTAHASAANQVVGAAQVTDAGTAAYGGFSQISGTTKIIVKVETSSLVSVTSLVPMTWASTDSLYTTITYEAA